ncbi:sensor histidine kinase [Anaeromyxobacter dehalogenans]|uniref:histidine kinase n=1 Tax=Anaeromyxobacter dehalogenans (strain 2CP-C) TaxID=290397 RepID=Q2IGA9_ANADE|nr:HAMP domain-containing sensor histidine kinase [Anaeromyxobacter dehalogenans]ABC83621.1 periplasmic sensor signal transduction histidine kinase [Anaeromyxobacter dehalogenans 2CP-C]
MKLAARLWLLGAVVPLLGMLAAAFAAGELFRASLERALDDALMGQAAAEAVSLFDAPGGKPHLHMATSPLRGSLTRFAPAAALYDAAGTRILVFPEDAPAGLVDDCLAPVGLGPEPRLATRLRADHGGRDRVLTVAVTSPDGARWALELSASLEGVHETVHAFRRTGFAMALLLGLGLFLLQTFHARRLARRVNALTGHMAALREGNLEAAPPAAEGDDEIAALGRVVADATAKLRRAREAQDRLVADAAHELRTPLTLMRTSIDLALRRRREAPELVETLDETRREVDRLARLATRLLDLATAGRGAWDRTAGDLVQAAHEAAEAARAAAEAKGILVQVEGPEALPATFDAAGVRQALDNLLSNAIRHGPRGRPVTIRLARAGDLVRIAVQDEGPGIAPGDRERVFQAFERGNGEAAGPEGAGLGLAIVAEIARGHGGRAYVAETGAGAEVVIEVPLDSGPLDSRSSRA